MKKKLSLLILFAGALFLVYYFRLFSTGKFVTITEHGVVERLTVIFYLSGAVFTLWKVATEKGSRLFWTQALIGFLFFSCRELDFHRLFTQGQSTMRLDFYRNANFPIIERLLFFCFYAGIFAVLVHLGLQLLPLILHGLVQQQYWARTACLFLVCFLTAYFVERIVGDILKKFFEPKFSEAIEIILEETFELTASCLMLLSFIEIQKPWKEWLTSRIENAALQKETAA